jgi:putative hydrolase of the HAD superfamily
MQNANGPRHRKIKVIIFDMDNTLLDFVNAKLRSLEAVVKCLGRDDDDQLLQYFLTDSVDVENIDCIARYLKDRSIYSQETFNKCCEVYKKIKLENITIYPGVLETLDKLKAEGFKLAVVTDAFMDNAKARLKKTRLIDYFDLLVTADLVDSKKPEPDSIIYTLAKLEVSSSEAVFVGDSLRRDIALGNDLGLITVYAKYGETAFHEEVDIEADYFINNIEELIGIIDNL